jgi:hypothetical protein
MRYHTAMKPHIRKFTPEPFRYPAYRMSVAMDRLLDQLSAGDQAQATRWALAWARAEIASNSAQCEMRAAIAKAAKLFRS